MVTWVPEMAGEGGEADAVTAVQGVAYVKRSAGVVGVVPAGVVTVTSTAPSAWAGATAVMVESLTAVKLAAAVVPNVTAVAPVKPEPVIVTAEPPAAGPACGATSDTLKKAPTVKDHV